MSAAGKGMSPAAANADVTPGSANGANISTLRENRDAYEMSIYTWMDKVMADDE